MVSQLLDHCMSEFGGHDTVSYSFDIVGLGGENRPPIFGRSRPDLYGKRPSDSLEIIGEAKTKGDLENIHTIQQIADYSEYVEPRHAKLLLIVPWPLTRACKSLVLTTCKNFISWREKLTIVPGGSM
jgi:hypothetical protein